MLENSRRRLSAKTHFWDDDVEALVAPITRDVVPGWQLNISSISSIIFYDRPLSLSEEEKLKSLLLSKSFTISGHKFLLFVLESDVSRFCLFSARAYLLRVQINIAENAHTDTYCYKYFVCSFSVLV